MLLRLSSGQTLNTPIKGKKKNCLEAPNFDLGDSLSRDKCHGEGLTLERLGWGEAGGGYTLV